MANKRLPDRDRIAAALAGSTADFTEIRLSDQDATSVSFRGKILESATRSFSTGGCVRALSAGGGWGYVSFNDVGRLDEHVALACQCAKAVTGEAVELADVPVVEDDIAATQKIDIRNVPLESKKKDLQAYNEVILGTEKIVDSRAGYSDRFRETIYANSTGTWITEAKPFAQILLLAIARDGEVIQQGYEGEGDTSSGYALMNGREQWAQDVARRAVEALAAPSVAGGTYPVICDPKLAGVFIHEAFGHMSEADFIYENEQARKMMVLGRKFGSPGLNVFDDPTLGGLWGSYKYDDEGTPTSPTALITAGELTGRLHSRQTAEKMGEKPTGNARAISHRHAPIVRMSNTYIANGDSSFEEMISDIDEGVYACGMYGGQTMLESFSFSAGHGYMIRKGKIAEMVRDVVMSGNLFETMANISAIGNDLKLFGGGGCGKGGQSPLPVSLGSPHLRIDDLLIGGKSD